MSIQMSDPYKYAFGDYNKSKHLEDKKVFHFKNFTRSSKFLISGTPSDAHTWNLVFLQLLIEEHGYKVINLGACVPQAFLIQQCLLHKPNVLVISSVNGHGYDEGTNLIHAIRNIPELQYLTTLIGGKLGTRDLDNRIHTEDLLNAGFDAVFHADSALPEFIKLLESSKTPHERSEPNER